MTLGFVLLLLIMFALCICSHVLRDEQEQYRRDMEDDE